MKLISMEKFRSENESSILNLKNSTEIRGGIYVEASSYVEKESTGGYGGQTDCVDRHFNDTGGLMVEVYDN